MINKYGNILIENFGHDIDTVTQSFDNFDQKCLIKACEIAKEKKLTFIDFGAGKCGYVNTLSKKLYEKNLQCQLFAIDVSAYEKYADKNIHFIQNDMNTFYEAYMAISPDIVYSRRTMHYLPYKSAENFLSQTFERMQNKGWLFLSVYGVDYKLKNIHNKNHIVSAESNHFSDELVKKYQIKEPVYIYKVEELAVLVNKAGFNIQFIECSEFGDVKLIAKKGS